jgi:hypothetical protein
VRRRRQRGRRWRARAGCDRRRAPACVLGRAGHCRRGGERGRQPRRNGAAARRRARVRACRRHRCRRARHDDCRCGRAPVRVPPAGVRSRARSAAAAVSSRRSAGAPGPAEASAASMFGVSVGVPARISSVLAPGPPWARKSRPCRSPLGPSANSTAPEAAPPDDCLPNRTSSAAAAASTATASSASRRRCGTPCTTRA